MRNSVLLALALLAAAPAARAEDFEAALEICHQHLLPQYRGPAFLTIPRDPGAVLPETPYDDPAIGAECLALERRFLSQRPNNQAKTAADLDALRQITGRP